MPAKKAKPTRQATSAKPRKANKAIETVADVVEEYQEIKAEIEERKGAADEDAAEPPLIYDPELIDPSQLSREPGEALKDVTTSQSGLLARFPDGTLREPTSDELSAMGRVLAAMLFPRQSDDAENTEVNPKDPPKPKISGNHCRLCASFAGNDHRGPLWSNSGHCLTYKHVQNPVEPEHCCERFVFNEGLRG